MPPIYAMRKASLEITTYIYIYVYLAEKLEPFDGLIQILFIVRSYTAENGRGLIKN